MADTRWLVRHNGHPTWHCVKDVPRPLQAAVGKRRLMASLRTHDLATAQARRWDVLARFERILSAARAETGASVHVEAGLEWRDTLARLEAGDPAVVRAHGGHGGPTDSGWWTGAPNEDALTPQDKARINAEMALSLHVDGVKGTHGEEAAATLRDVALGRATPLLHHVDAWLSEGGAKGPLKERTKSQYRTDVGRLEAWAKSAGVAPTIEAFTKKVAGRYVSEMVTGAGLDPLTGNRRISAASAYWRWLVKRGVAEVNPWTGQSVAKPAQRATAERPKRPFTDAEMVALLSGDPGQELADAMRVAALSGMRLEEVYRLTVATSAGGWFDVRASKTRAGVRRVPIHSDLAEIVVRRRKDKAPGAFLFDEAGAPSPGRERSAAVSKRFGRYRQAVGVHDKQEDRRHSAVDFHSFRRWFITKARNAGQDRAMVAAVVGHEAGNLTDDTYSAGPSDALRRAVVEAVKLPLVIAAGSTESAQGEAA